MGPPLYPHLLPLTHDELHAQQKVQEITQKFPATHLSGDTYQHRCWSTRLQSRARHWPLRWVHSFYRDLKSDEPDSTVTLDEKNPRASRIVYNDKKSEDRGSPTPVTSTPGTVVGGSERDDIPTGKRFCFLLSWPIFIRMSVPLLSEENTSDTGKEGEETEVSRGMRRYRYFVRFLLTSASSGERLQGYKARYYPRPRQRTKGACGRIRPSQNHLRDYLRRLRKSRSSLSAPCSKFTLIDPSAGIY